MKRRNFITRCVKGLTALAMLPVISLLPGKQKEELQTLVYNEITITFPKDKPGVTFYVDGKRIPTNTKILPGGKWVTVTVKGNGKWRARNGSKAIRRDGTNQSTAQQERQAQ